MSTDVVHVWLVVSDVGEPELKHLRGLLDDEERTRVTTLRHQVDRHRFIVAHGATRTIVGGYLGAPPQELRFTRGRHGKPALTGAWTGAHVNISHSGDLTMVAISPHRQVGIDIQQIVPRLDATAMASRYYPADEARYVAMAPDAQVRADRFARLWARKEAVLKAFGGRLMEGMRIPVRGEGRIDHATEGPLRVRDVRAPSAYRAAIALAGADGYRVVLRQWSPPATEPPLVADRVPQAMVG